MSIKTVKISNQDIEKLKKIVDVINIRLGMSSSPHIFYVSFKEFPKEIQQFEIISWLEKLDKDFNAIKFTSIIGREPSEQAVGISIDDDNIKKFKEIKKTIYKKLKVKVSPRDQLMERFVKVRVKEPLYEGGASRKKGDVFETTEGRARQLGSIIEVLKILKEKRGIKFEITGIQPGVSKTGEVERPNTQEQPKIPTITAFHDRGKNLWTFRYSGNGKEFTPGGSYKTILGMLWKKKRIIKKGMKEKDYKGSLVDTDEIKQEAGYKDNDAPREAIKGIKRKLKNKGFPCVFRKENQDEGEFKKYKKELLKKGEPYIDIENTPREGYMLVIANIEVKGTSNSWRSPTP